MNDLSASLGIGNLEFINERLRRIEEISLLYNKEFKNIPGLKKMSYDNDRKSSYWLYPILVERRNDFIKKMKEKNIPVSVVHLGIDKNTIFGGINNDLINQRFFDNNQIHLPINDQLSDDQIDYIINSVTSGW
jgi:perosamine synthetase